MSRLAAKSVVGVSRAASFSASARMRRQSGMVEAGEQGLDLRDEAGRGRIEHRHGARRPSPPQSGAARASASASGCDEGRREAARPPAPRRPRASGRRVSARQRERMVGRSRPGAWLTMRNRRARRRLLHHLEERVGAVGVEVLGAVDDADRGSRHCRRWSRTASRARRTASTEILVARVLALGGRGVRRRATRLGCDRAATWRAAGMRRVDGEARRARPRRRDWRGASGRPGRPASPCRCRAGRRSARRGAGGPSAIASTKAASASAWPTSAGLLARARDARSGRRARHRRGRAQAASRLRPGRRARHRSRQQSGQALGHRRRGSPPRRRRRAAAGVDRRRSAPAPPPAIARKASRRRAWKARASASKRSAASPRPRAAARPRPGEPELRVAGRGSGSGRAGSGRRRRRSRAPSTAGSRPPAAPW